MSQRPLTHHEILHLVEPFTRRGRHVDLAASDRLERRLAFKPIEHPAEEGRQPLLREHLVLHGQGDDRYRLVRTLTDAAGLSATLECAGTDLDGLLEQIERIDPSEQFRTVSGVRIALSYRLGPGDPREQGIGGRVTRLFANAVARLGDVRLRIDADSGYPKWAGIELWTENGQTLSLPPDFLAVIGWTWRPLRLLRGKWSGPLRIAKAEPERTRDAERKVEQTVTHLVETFAQPAAQFHPRFRRARWRAAFQRGLPLLVGTAIVAASPAVKWLPLEPGSFWTMLLFHAPPLLLVAYFVFDLPLLEIPPLPRPLPEDAWQHPQGVQPAKPAMESLEAR
jgi:hypothetical protein